MNELVTPLVETVEVCTEAFHFSRACAKIRRFLAQHAKLLNERPERHASSQYVNRPVLVRRPGC